MPDLELEVAQPEPTSQGRISDQIRLARGAGESLALSVGGQEGWMVCDPDSLDLLLALAERLEAIAEVRDRLRSLNHSPPGLSLDQARDHVQAKYGLSLPS